MSIMNRLVEERIPHWSCPDCRTTYFGAVYPFRFCPACRDKKRLAEKEYWDKKIAEAQSVAQSIIDQILAKNKSDTDGKE